MIKKIALFCFILAAICFVSDSAFAQTLTLNMEQDIGGSTTSKIFNTIMLITVLSIAPSILIMMTSFTRIIVVLSIVRSALATQATPPNMILVSLALFLTMFVMGPTVEKSWTDGIKPMFEEKVDAMDGLQKASEPIKEFMIKNTREKDLLLFTDLSKSPKPQTMEQTPLKTVIPAFMISELRRAFEIGFLIFVPFLIIDMVIASVLMSMGMMMLPPSVLALPFKVIFFVMVDGWYMLSGSLIQSFK